MVCQVLPDDVPEAGEAGEVDGGPGRYLPTAQPNTLVQLVRVRRPVTKGHPATIARLVIHPHMPPSARAE